jgi:hypothetical protein
MSAVVVAPNSNKISAMNLSAEAAAAAAAAVVQQQCSSSAAAAYYIWLSLNITC